MPVRLSSPGQVETRVQRDLIQSGVTSNRINSAGLVNAKYSGSEIVVDEEFMVGGVVAVLLAKPPIGWREPAN